MKIDIFSFKIKKILLLIILLILYSCKPEDVPPPTTNDNSVNVAININDPLKVPLVTYINASESMKGFLTKDNIYTKVVENLVNISTKLAKNSSTAEFFKVNDKVTSLNGQELMAFMKPDFYSSGTTFIEKVLNTDILKNIPSDQKLKNKNTKDNNEETQKEDKNDEQEENKENTENRQPIKLPDVPLKIIVTDFSENLINPDLLNIINEYLSKNMSVGILCVKSPFDGQVKYHNVNESFYFNGQRNFYILMFGKYENIFDYHKSLKTRLKDIPDKPIFLQNSDFVIFSNNIIFRTIHFENNEGEDVNKENRAKDKEYKFQRHFDLKVTNDKNENVEENPLFVDEVDERIKEYLINNENL